ncbi:MAG: glutathione S-transferase family protein [Gammaproteobacteria bacterium]|nr:glutathione S-transferase family protein [Gammaproteobacteria bacterium]
MKPHLISFDICPYVQRSVITLQEKGVEFDTTYIDLDDPPQWFLRVSPLGKVPALQVEGTTLFESAVINEYLDEVHPPPMHPQQPLRRAQNRAWIELGSALLVDQYRLMVAEDEQAFEQARAETRAKLRRLEPALGEGPYFNGPRLALIDAAFAPLFQRFAVLESIRPLEPYDGLPAVERWAHALLERPTTTTSVSGDFVDAFKAYIAAKGPYLARFL